MKMKEQTSLSVVVDCPFKIYKTYSFTVFIHDKIKLNIKIDLFQS
jgi:hypothetical protein